MIEIQYLMLDPGHKLFWGFSLELRLQQKISNQMFDGQVLRTEFMPPSQAISPVCAYLRYASI